MNALEDKYIAQLKEEAAAKSRYFTEDLAVEQTRARATIAESQGNPTLAAQLRKDADRTAYNEEQNRRIEDYKRTHDMTDPANKAQEAQLEATVALNKQAYAIQQNTDALNTLTTSVRNEPSGFKLSSYVQQYATGAPFPKLPGQLAPSGGPFDGLPSIPSMPGTLPRYDDPRWPSLPPTPSAPTTTGTISRSSFTFAPGSIVVNESRTPQLTADAVGKMLASQLDQFKERSLGANDTRAAALELLPS
jgi:hypothetical protein